jgi:hypothetical protein
MAAPSLGMFIVEGRRARCLGCGAAGPIRKDAEEAQEASLDVRS